MHTQHEHDHAHSVKMMQLFERYNRIYRKRKNRNIAIYSAVIVAVIIAITQLL